jgi:CBS domain containing-hemolysin-like protein
MLDSADRAAELPVLDRDRIQRAVRLSDMTVGEAMVPLASITGASGDITLKKLVEMSHRSGHRRIPLYKDNISNIVAIASWTIWDELDAGFLQRKPGEFEVTPHFTSPIQRLDELMPVLMARNDHMAVVVDEFGSATGIVTLEDLMLILLGDAARGVHLGPKGWGKPMEISRLEGGVIVMDAQTRLVEAAEILDVELPSHEFHTVGGFMTSHLRRIPLLNDSIEEFGYRFTVVEASSRAPLRIRVEPSSAN